MGCAATVSHAGGQSRDTSRRQQSLQQVTRGNSRDTSKSKAIIEEGSDESLHNYHSSSYTFPSPGTIGPGLEPGARRPVPQNRHYSKFSVPKQKGGPRQGAG